MDPFVGIKHIKPQKIPKNGEKYMGNLGAKEPLFESSYKPIEW